MSASGDASHKTDVCGGQQIGASVSFFDDITNGRRYRPAQPKSLTATLTLIDETIRAYRLHGSDEPERVHLLPAIADLGYGFKPMAWTGDILGLTYRHPTTGQVVIAPRTKKMLMPDLYYYAVAHEFVHALVDRMEVGQERYCRGAVWRGQLDEWHERVAHEGAARLLVPPAAVWQAGESGWTLDETARALVVPSWLVVVRLRQI